MNMVLFIIPKKTKNIRKIRLVSINFGLPSWAYHILGCVGDRIEYHSNLSHFHGQTKTVLMCKGKWEKNKCYVIVQFE